MEFIGILIIGTIVVTYLVRRSNNYRDVIERNVPSESVTRGKRGAARPLPFNPVSAQKTQSNKTITGAAYVIDGDSIVIEKTQIRLFGVDAPEIHHPHGRNAKWALVKLCKGRHVRAEIVEKDHFGRCVARCYLNDGRDLSAEMVKLGLAIDWPKYSGGKYGLLETSGLRKKLWLADARQKGRIHVWESFDARQRARRSD